MQPFEKLLLLSALVVRSTWLESMTALYLITETILCRNQELEMVTEIEKKMRKKMMNFV